MRSAERIKNRVAFITGASSGIGKACAEQFAQLGTHLVITARRIDRLHSLSEELSNKYGIRCTSIGLDVRDRKSVEAAIEKLKIEGIEIDILLNNAGLALSTNKLQDGICSDWDIVIDTNLKGLLYVTRSILPSMIQRNSGHIINIGSIAGHGFYSSGNVYCATKHAVRAISHSLRLDLSGTAIRVSEIAPGAVETEFSEVRFANKEKAKQFYKGFEPLVAEDIADAVIYCATRPLHVNISEIVVFPQAQSSLTDIYRDGQLAKDVFSVIR